MSFLQALCVNERPLLLIFLLELAAVEIIVASVLSALLKISIIKDTFK